ncbi:hypothetical protein [Parapedobacter tibetensis]|uniref:hypothetical protein n=1 Tax=Parapedobacter tibetensis TaxID=2972951 RepID=UPI00214DDF7E|nr:hypothetical protein [Parapedobacter tibetensis]
MQTTYRLKAKDISMSLLKSLKTLFEGQEVEIIVKSVEQKKGNLTADAYNGLLQMVKDNRQKAPVVPQDIDIRGMIDDAHNPEGLSEANPGNI